MKDHTRICPLDTTSRPPFFSVQVRSGAIVALCYAPSAWWGFTSANDRLHLDGFIRRSVRQSYCPSDLDIVDIIDRADEKMFQLVLTNLNYVLSSLLPDKTDQHYVVSEQDATTDNLLTNATSSSFMIRMLYADCY